MYCFQQLFQKISIKNTVYQEKKVRERLSHVYGTFYRVYRVDNEKVGVDNEKALGLDNRIFFSYFDLFNIEISPKNATEHPVA